MNERDFSISGREFRLSKIDPFKQYHVVRRLGPIMSDIAPVALKIQEGLKKADQTEEEKFEVVIKLAAPIFKGLASLSDEDSNYLLLTLLSAAEVKQSPANNWARVARDGNLLIQDMDLPTMMQVAGRAFAYNLGGFFATAPQTSHGGK